MPWPLLALGAAQAGMSLYSGISGSKKAKSAGKATARMIQMETDIAVRRAERDLTDLMNITKGGIYASNVLMSGSSENYLNKMKYRGYEGIEDIRRVGAAQARAAKKGGQTAASGLMTQGITGAIGAAASAAGSYYGYQQNTRTLDYGKNLTTPTPPTGRVPGTYYGHQLA